MVMMMVMMMLIIGMIEGFADKALVYHTTHYHHQAHSWHYSTHVLQTYGRVSSGMISV